MKARLSTLFLISGFCFALPTTADGDLYAQNPAPTKPAQVSFHFERTGLEVPDYLLEVNEDGSAHYKADQVYPSSGSRSDGSPNIQHVDNALSVSPSTTRKVFAAARELNRFNDPCASTAKNIADTGKKTLRYTGEDGDGTCTYNYSQDKRVVMLTDTFQAIAATLDLGRKLAFDHRFDRLGLDADMAHLIQEADAGRAIELGTIAPTLRSITEDSELLERVRARAAILLQQAQPRQPPAS